MCNLLTAEVSQKGDTVLLWDKINYTFFIKLILGRKETRHILLYILQISLLFSTATLHEHNEV